jgi:hypothetical protein
MHKRRINKRNFALLAPFRGYFTVSYPADSFVSLRSLRSIAAKILSELHEYGELV